MLTALAGTNNWLVALAVNAEKLGATPHTAEPALYPASIGSVGEISTL